MALNLGDARRPSTYGWRGETEEPPSGDAAAVRAWALGLREEAAKRHWELRRLRMDRGGGEVDVHLEREAFERALEASQRALMAQRWANRAAQREGLGQPFPIAEQVADPLDVIQLGPEDQVMLFGRLSEL